MVPQSDSRIGIVRSMAEDTDLVLGNRSDSIPAGSRKVVFRR